MEMPRIDKNTFDRISKHVNENFGIHFSDAKQNLVENRLMKRLRHLNVESFPAYTDILFSQKGKEERELLTDLLSTNKTYFYRESAHFDFLEKVIANSQPNENFSVWSAACSGGDEAYTIGSIFEEHAKRKPLRYSILGTDISSRMIAEASIGKYNADRISTLPEALIKTYFDKVKSIDGTVMYQASRILRQAMTFKKFNLIKDIPSLPQKFDFIFCRNVLIYFKEETKLHVINEMIRKLKPGGYLILGHCEGMSCRNTELEQLQPAVFKKPLL